MTAPAPRDQLRQRLAEALFDADISLPGGIAGASYQVTADRLLPVVEQYAAEAAARALEAAYVEDRTTVAKLDPIERLTCFLVKSEDLVTRAADLRAQAGERQ